MMKDIKEFFHFIDKNAKKLISLIKNVLKLNNLKLHH